MKKLFLGAALMLAFAGTATAQVSNNAQVSPATADTTATSVVTAPAATATATTATTPQGGQYEKVEQSQIAPAVLKEAVAKYKDYALVEALAAADGSMYKLVLTKDGKDVAAYYKSSGEFIKEETV